jgi:two-component system cell cycle sensor histidine kinase/response regulator CckA
MISKCRVTRFSRNMWMSACLVALLVLAFALYIEAEGRVDQAFELRHRSFLLANEVRQSSDDLTRFARSYVTTGDPLYKQRFQDVLDIRDGKKPRPAGNLHVETVGREVFRDGNQPAVPLLELMRQAGFTVQEFNKLAEAKANSDALTVPEFEAMKLTASIGPDSEADRDRARTMMFDDKYSQGKAAVLKSIDEFYGMVVKHTFDAIQTAQKYATILRYSAVVCGLGLIIMLWRTYDALKDTMGGSVDVVCAHIARIGNGDFSTPIEMKDSRKNNVLGWLSETQAKLNETNRDREKTDEALRASEIRYRRLFEAAKDGILILDFESGTVVDVNPFLCEMLALTYEEFLGKKIYELGLFKDICASQDKFTELQQKEYIRYDDLPLESADGRRIDVEFVSNVYEANNRKVIQCNVRDITERMRVDDMLHNSEARYRRLFEAAQDGILILDFETGKVVDVNPFLMEMLGMSHEQFMGKKIYELGLFKDIVANQSKFAELQEKKYIRYDDMPLKTADGRKIDVEFVSNAYVANNRQVIQCNIRDITERKHAQAALHETQNRLQQAVTAGNVGLWDWDLRTNQIYYSLQCKRQIGYEDDEIGSGLSEWEERIHPEDHGRMIQVTKDYLVNQSVPYTHEFRVRHKSGSYRTILSQGDLMFDDKGQPVRMLGSHMDITEQKSLQEQFQQAQKMEAVGRLAGGIAHDFNNLLGVIIGYTDFALESMAESEPSRDDIKRVRAAGEKAAGLTRQLLAFSRKQVLQPRVLDLRKLVADDEKMLARMIGEDIEIIVVPAERLGCVRADPGQLEQVLMNLVINARDAMPEGGKLTIEILNAELDETSRVRQGLVKPGPYVMLAVSDTGIGMDKATREQIFDPFFTTKELGKGTGLGLATVYGIVEQSNGHIFVYSELGKGSTFKIYLPRVDERDSQIGPTKPGTTANGTETILLVEDDEPLRMLGQRILEGLGYTVLMAASGEEALLLIERQEQPVHLIMTDVIMPGMSGRVLADRIATTRPEIRVLYMSGYTDDSIGRHGVLSEDMHFISKPFTKAAIAQKIRDVLDLPQDVEGDGTSANAAMARRQLASSST